MSQIRTVKLCLAVCWLMNIRVCLAYHALLNRISFGNVYETGLDILLVTFSVDGGDFIGLWQGFYRQQ